MLRITDHIALDPEEIEEHFIRSSGPGGQHVNKTATAVQLRFDAAHSPSLPDDVRGRLLERAGSRLTSEGVIVITADNRRSQRGNREDARERLIQLIRAAAVPPRRRKRTRPSRAARAKRLESKRRRGELKASRRPIHPKDV